MRLINRISQNISDMRVLGAPVVSRHLSRLRKNRQAMVNLPGYGPVTIRSGDSDFNAIRQVFVAREYDMSRIPTLEARVRARYEEILASGGKPIIADLGANIGAATIWFSMQFPEARILAVEPEPGNFAVLGLNIAGHANIRAVDAAIGAEPGFVSLDDQGESWAVTASRAESGIRIVTVEEVFAASGGDTPFIVKVDIEGFEADLFKSNVEWLEKAYVVIVEPHDWMLPGEFSSRAFQKAMAVHDFEMFLNGENIIYARV